MDIPTNTWYDAIFKRRSRRRYTGSPLAEETLDKIEKVCDEFRPFGGTRAVLVRNPTQDIFKGAVRSYGKITGARHYVAFIADKSDYHSQTALGNMGEGIVLEATSHDINTCWIAGFFHPDRAEVDVDLEEHEEISAVTPLGKAVEKKQRAEKTMARALRSHKRKDIATLVNKNPSELTKWIRTAIEAARLAPSAANRQPWRFEVDDTGITVRVDKQGGVLRYSKQLDCGIAMLHLEIGALKEGIRGKWSFLEKPEVARFEID